MRRGGRKRVIPFFDIKARINRHCEKLMGRILRPLNFSRSYNRRLKEAHRTNELLCQEKEERIEEFYSNHATPIERARDGYTC